MIYDIITYCIKLFCFTQQKKVGFMGRDLRGRELRVGISQRKDGLYTARFISKQTGKNIQQYFPKLQECRHYDELICSCDGRRKGKRDRKNRQCPKYCVEKYIERQKALIYRHF